MTAVAFLVELTVAFFMAATVALAWITAVVFLVALTEEFFTTVVLA